MQALNDQVGLNQVLFSTEKVTLHPSPPSLPICSASGLPGTELRGVLQDGEDSREVPCWSWPDSPILWRCPCPALRALAGRDDRGDLSLLYVWLSVWLSWFLAAILKGNNCSLFSSLCDLKFKIIFPYFQLLKGYMSGASFRDLECHGTFFLVPR